MTTDAATTDAATPPIEAIVFDLDGTLAASTQSQAEVLAPAFATVGVEPLFTLAEYHDRIDAIEGIHSGTELRERCFVELVGEHGHDPEVGRAIADAYDDEREYDAVRFLPGAEDALAALGERYPLALVTNGGPDTQWPKIEALDIADRFEKIVLAGYDTPAKPDPEPFAVALDALDVPAENALYIGNSLDHDVRGAHAAGLQACWIPDGSPSVDDADGPTPEYVLDSLAEHDTLF